MHTQHEQQPAKREVKEKVNTEKDVPSQKISHVELMKNENEYKLLWTLLFFCLAQNEMPN